MNKFIVIILLVLGGLGLLGLGYTLANNKNEASTTNSTGQTNANTKVLDYNNKGLTSVGPDIYKQTATTELILSNNLLTSLPSQMGEMTNLTVLRLDHNKLQGSLIGEIRKMTKLVTLDASYNEMTGVPAEIGQLSNLETLNLSYNQLTGLPNELANAKNLKVLNLSYNKVSASTIAQLQQALPNTQIIY